MDPANDAPAIDHQPLSAHLTLYRPQITSMLCILHRVSDDDKKQS